jgi:hypothetical protein
MEKCIAKIVHHASIVRWKKQVKGGTLSVSIQNVFSNVLDATI